MGKLEHSQHKRVSGMEKNVGRQNLIFQHQAWFPPGGSDHITHGLIGTQSNKKKALNCSKGKEFSTRLKGFLLQASLMVHQVLVWWLQQEWESIWIKICKIIPLFKNLRFLFGEKNLIFILLVFFDVAGSNSIQIGTTTFVLLVLIKFNL